MLRDSPLNIWGEQHDLPVLPKGTLKEFSREGIIDAKRHINLFIDVCDFNHVEYDDVMVRLFLRTLSRQCYEWYTTLPSRSIGSFNDLKAMFLTMFTPLISYHTLLTNFTEIGSRKNERIRYFDLGFNKTLSKILQDKIPNVPVILGCYKNVMPPNVNMLLEHPKWISCRKQWLNPWRWKKLWLRRVMIPILSWEEYRGSCEAWVSMVKEPLVQERVKRKSCDRFKIKPMEEGF